MNLLSLVGQWLDNICQIRRKWYYSSVWNFLQRVYGMSNQAARLPYCYLIFSGWWNLGRSVAEQGLQGLAHGIKPPLTGLLKWTETSKAWWAFVTSQNKSKAYRCTGPSHKKKNRASRTSSTLIRSIENTCNIYISKKIYYESIFNDLPNGTNYIP
jgi:hypothetical protein